MNNTRIVEAKRYGGPCTNPTNFSFKGGRTEYVITIACMIGKSRMKGDRVVTPLIPYGAEKPSAGMVKTALEYSMETVQPFAVAWRHCQALYRHQGYPDSGAETLWNIPS